MIMSYPPPPYSQQPPQGYPQQQQPQEQQAYQHPAYPQQAYQPQPGYAPAAYQPQAAAPGGSYSWTDLYGLAAQGGSYMYDEGWYAAVVEAAEYGRTKAGDKSAFTVKFRTASGVNAGKSPVTTTIAVSPAKNDGTPNEAGMSIMMRQLGAMGVPVGPAHWPPALGPPPPAGFWIDPQTGQDIGLEAGGHRAAAMMAGRPCEIKITHDDSFDGTPRMKVSAIRPPRPGAPMDWPRGDQAAAGYPAQAALPPAAQPGSPYPGYQQPQPGFMQPGPAVPPGQPAPPVAAQPIPAQPQWTPQAVPGQGGLGEFTQPGQSQQPWMGQQQQQAGPPPGWQPQPVQQQLPYPQQGQPPVPQAQYNGAPQQPQQPQQPQVPKPPWEQ